MPDLEDADFIKGMESMFDMDEDAVKQAIENLDADDLSTLSDAVANNDRDAAEQIMATLQTNERINSLFRGNLEDEDEDNDTAKQAHKVSDSYGFKHGDHVQVEVRERDPDTDKVTVKHETGTVYLPVGPGDDLVGVKIDGKSRMVKRDRLKKLQEQVLGMVNLPNLERMQQLAGIQPAGVQPAQEIAVPPADSMPADSAPCDSAQQAMEALEIVQTLLPSIRLADLKTIRQKIVALQTTMNESAVVMRARKV